MLKFTSTIAVALVAVLMFSTISLNTSAADANPMDRIRLRWAPPPNMAVEAM